MTTTKRDRTRDEIHDRIMGVIRHYDCHREAQDRGDIERSRIADGERISETSASRYWAYISEGTMYCDECGFTIIRSDEKRSER